MARYVGLTDDPERRKREHGNPADWWQKGPFSTESEARDWEKDMLSRGYAGDIGGAGWRYGYTFSKS